MFCSSEIALVPLLVLSGLFSGANGFVRKCHKKDPHFNDCLVEAANIYLQQIDSARGILVEGSRMGKMFTVKTGIVDGTFMYDNLAIYDSSNGHLDFKYNLETNTISGTIYMPKLYFTLNVTTTGTFMGLIVNGRAFARGEIQGLSASYIYKLRPKQENKKIIVLEPLYYNIDGYEKYQPKVLDVKAENKVYAESIAIMYEQFGTLFSQQVKDELGSVLRDNFQTMLASVLGRMLNEGVFKIRGFN